LTNEKILSIYDKKLASLNIPFRERKIETSFGKTNIIICGDDKKPPLFLVHGLNSAAPFAIDTVSFLLEKHQVFAIDILGQPNKSIFIRLSKQNNSYGNWLLEIINHFNFEKVTLLGISFGAFPILKTLLIDDKKIKNAILISPAGIINGNLWKTISRFLIPMKRFQKTKKERFLETCLFNINDESNFYNTEFLKEVFLNFNMDFSLTPNFTKNELAKIKTPITIIAGKNDFFVPALKLKKRSEKNIASLANFIFLKNSKHIPSKSVLKDLF
jgi:pimeloyl-ACP methyl ester carboxylesterase